MGDFLEPTGGGTQTVSTLSGEQEQLLAALNDLLIPQIGKGVTPFGGTRPGEVPFGPLQQQGFDLAGGLGQLAQQSFGFDTAQGQQFLGQAEQATQAGLDFDPTQDILKAFERIALEHFLVSRCWPLDRDFREALRIHG